MERKTETRKRLRTREDVSAHLNAEPYYVHNGLAARFNSGDIRVECGNDVWPEDWYSDLAWERMSWPLVFGLMESLPGANDFRLHYRRDHDFHHVEFTLDGERYDVQWYKIYTVTRLRDGQKMTFCRLYDRVVDFFRRGEHRDEKNWRG
jgi:hypothetical protein